MIKIDMGPAISDSQGSRGGTVSGILREVERNLIREIQGKMQTESLLTDPLDP